MPLSNLSEENPQETVFVRHVATTRRRLAAINKNEGNHALARDELLEAAKSLRRLTEHDADDELQFLLATSLRELAEEQRALGDAHLAAGTVEEAVGLLTSLRDKNPDDPRYPRELELTRHVLIEPSKS